MTCNVERAGTLIEFSPVIQDHYYSGDTYPLTNREQKNFSLKFLRLGATSLAKFVGGGLGMRRNWKHIRNNASGLYLFWFPIKGQLTISQDAVSEVKCAPGEFIVTCGDRPFHVRADPAGDSHCEQLHILVPSHLIRSRLPTIDQHCARPFSAKAGDIAIGMQVYSALFEHGESASPESISKFAIATLDAICEEVRRNTASSPIQIDTKKNNLERVLRFVDQHISTQGLTAGRVAAACNMSRRYLHYLLKHSSITFGEYLWEARLKQAKEWLHDPEFHHFHIVDIAYMCGFRSPSHFSSAFKARFGYAPSNERLNFEGNRSNSGSGEVPTDTHHP